MQHSFLVCMIWGGKGSVESREANLCSSVLR